MEDSFGVGGPQTVFLSRVSPIETPIWFLRGHVPREVLSSVRCCHMWSDNDSRSRLLQHPAEMADSLPWVESTTAGRELERSVP